MEINAVVYFDEDDKDYTYCDMLKVLMRRLKKHAGLDLTKMDDEQAQIVLRKLVSEFASLVDGDWLDCAFDEIM